MPGIYDRVAGQLVLSDYCREPWVSRPSPGGNFRGPVRELARFWSMVLHDGCVESGERFLSSASVCLLRTPVRTGQFDQTLQHVIDFAPGVIVNSRQYGPETVPYGFGRLAGSATIGHGGSQCSMGFCDFENGLVVAWAANGFSGEGQHQRRNREINEAIYLDLGISALEIPR